MNALPLAVMIFAAVVIYSGLGMLFYTPEDGFGWLGLFLLSTLAVLLPLSFLLLRHSKRLAKDREDKAR